MGNLKIALKNKLKGAKKIALLGIGSELRSDDVAGMLVAQGLKDFAQRITNFKLFEGATAPENFTGEIRKFNPTHLIIVDSLDANKKPGEIVLTDAECISGASFCTHRLPIKVMTEYLRQSLNCKVIIIGIQPKSIEFGRDCSKEIKDSVKYIVEIIKDLC